MCTWVENVYKKKVCSLFILLLWYNSTKMQRRLSYEQVDSEREEEKSSLTLFLTSWLTEKGGLDS